MKEFSFGCYNNHIVTILTAPASAAEVTSSLSVWNFGGTWSSEITGVRFEIDTHSTVGMDKHLPVKILDRATGTVSNGFMNKTWMAKANAQYGRNGPIELFAINLPEKTVAVFIGRYIYNKFILFYFSFILQTLSPNLKRHSTEQIVFMW